MSTSLHDGVRLQELMLRIGVNDVAVGDAIGVSSQAVSKWRRTGAIAREHIKPLCVFLMCSADELLGLRPIGKHATTPVAKGDEAKLLAIFRRCSLEAKVTLVGIAESIIKVGSPPV